MKLLFYDKFLESLISLPSGVQKKVVEFQKKFRENSKSSAINYEKIITFKDKSLRSVRIDQTYRAIVKQPDEGSTYYLLYVDHHDKAYDWAKNKMFQWNMNTQSIQVFTTPEEVDYVFKEKVDKPDDGLYSEFKNKQLLEIGVPEILLPSIRKIKDIDDLEKIQEHISDDIFENLFYLSDGANIDTLITEVSEGKIKKNSISGEEESLNNQRNFIELTDDEIFNDILTGKLDKWKYYLHPSQKKLVEGDFSGSIKVSGGAGTGKTVAAIHRLKFLQKNNPSSKILFTTFTKTLTENLIQLSKGFDINVSNVEVVNFDSLAFKLIKKFNIIDGNFKVFGFYKGKNPSEIWDDVLDNILTSFSQQFLIDEYKKVILFNNITDLKQYFRISRVGRGKAISRKQRQEIWQLFEQYISIKSKYNLYHKAELYNLLSDFLENNPTKLYDHIILDELQDFSNVELRLIRKMVNVKRNDLFMVGDPMQKIYKNTINFSKAFINIRGKKSSRLRINYRTTEEIKKLALSIVKEIKFDDFDGEEEDKRGYVSLYRGVNPSYNVFKTKDKEVDAVTENIKKILNDGFEYSDIVISSRTRNGLKEFLSKLHNSDIPYSIFEKGKWLGDRKGVHLMTFHGIKGLEYKQVFLVDVNERTCPKFPSHYHVFSDIQKEEHLKSERSLLYVAVSRAMQNVEITGVGNKSKFINI